MPAPLAPPEPAPDLLTRHLPALEVYARSMVPARLRSKLDPADLVQETIAEAYRARARLEAMPDRDRAAYLFRALKNNLLDALRKHQKNATDPHFAQSSVQLEQWLVDDGSMPSARLAREERRRQVAEALAELPDTQRRAVELQVIDGLSGREIAARLGVTREAVGGLLRRGKQQLRERLGDTSGDDHAGT